MMADELLSQAEKSLAEKEERLSKSERRLAELEEQYEQSYLQLIGLFVTIWARIEVGLDYSNWIILNVTADGGTLSTQLPHSLNMKVDLFRRAHEQLSALTDFKADGLQIVSSVNALKECRHDLVHGSGKRIEGRSHNFIRLKLGGSSIRRLTKAYTNEDLIRLAKEANDLLEELTDHWDRLLDRFA